ncbi:MAG: PH domain-containing protein [Alphaproteobacteria bacterium]|jgi:hypothetical protein|nr:PH domain-containing protein [Alphaproteobacteria bacterium]
MKANGLPPLAPVPHLVRLLAPDEAVIYTAKLHPLHGWPWLLAVLLLAVAGWWLKPLWLASAALLVLYGLAFQNFEAAVTTRRLLLRQGRFGVSTEGILGEKIAEWQVIQRLVQRPLRAGTVRLVLKEGNTLRPLTLLWLWHPFSFIEALETLQMPPRG